MYVLAVVLHHYNKSHTQNNEIWMLSVNVNNKMNMETDFVMNMETAVNALIMCNVKVLAQSKISVQITFMWICVPLHVCLSVVLLFFCLTCACLSVQDFWVTIVLLLKPLKLWPLTFPPKCHPLMQISRVFLPKVLKAGPLSVTFLFSGNPPHKLVWNK